MTLSKRCEAVIRETAAQSGISASVWRQFTRKLLLAVAEDFHDFAVAIDAADPDLGAVARTFGARIDFASSRITNGR